MRPSIVKIAAWGDRYVASFYENILPCLLAPGNLPALVALSPTALIIYTDRPIDLPDSPGLKTTVRMIGGLPGADDLPAHRKVLARTDAESVRTASAA